LREHVIQFIGVSENAYRRSKRTVIICLGSGL
jgi:hypothetical protein